MGSLKPALLVFHGKLFPGSCAQDRPGERLWPKPGLLWERRAWELVLAEGHLRRRSKLDKQCGPALNRNTVHGSNTLGSFPESWAMVWLVGSVPLATMLINVSKVKTQS